MEKNRVLTHSPSLFDASRIEAFALEYMCLKRKQKHRNKWTTTGITGTRCIVTTNNTNWRGSKTKSAVTMNNINPCGSGNVRRTSCILKMLMCKNACRINCQACKNIQLLGGFKLPLGRCPRSHHQYSASNSRLLSYSIEVHT